MDVRQIKFNLDCSLMGNQKIIKGVRRGDANSIQFVIKLMNGHNPFSIKDDSQVVIYGIKPDGTKLCNNCSIDTDGNVVYTLHTQDTTSIGTVEYQLVVSHKSGNKIKVIVSPEFSCIVEDRLIYPTYTPLDTMPDDWESNYSNYYELIDGVFTKVESPIMGVWEDGKYYSCDDGLVESSDEIDILTNLIHKVNDLYAGCTIALDSEGIIIAFTDRENVVSTEILKNDVKTIVFGRNVKSTFADNYIRTLSLSDIYVYTSELYQHLLNKIGTHTTLHLIDSYNYIMPILKTAGSSNVVKSAINESGELVISYSNGTSVNLGCVVGTNGKDGTNGVDGKDGINGTDGKDGENGKDGKDGVNGISPEIDVVEESDNNYVLMVKTANDSFLTPNLKGKNVKVDVYVDDGIDYILGFSSGDGNPIVTPNLKGMSAYQIALNNGFEGTEKQWIESLKGKDGKTPQIESEEETTEDGGMNIYTFDDGTIIRVKNGTKGSQGDKGEQGIQGIQGEKGADGKDYVLTDADKTEIASLIRKGDSIPDYVTTESERVADNILSIRNSNSFVFAGVSDMHTDGVANSGDYTVTALKNVGKALSIINDNTQLDLVANFGDMIIEHFTDNYRQAFKYVRQCLSDIRKSSPYIQMQGNHDHLKTDTTEEGEQKYWAYIGANNVGVITDYNNKFRNYGYKDFDNYKIRTIYLNTADTSSDKVGDWYISEEQITWLINTALDLSDKSDQAEWGILVFSHHHITYGNDNLLSVINAFKGREEGKISHEIFNEKNNIVEIAYDFRNAEAEFISHFHGHLHNFRAETLGTNEVLTITIPNACYGRNNEYGTYAGYSDEVHKECGDTDADGKQRTFAKTKNSAKETAFNVVSVDRKYGRVYCYNYGAGIDRIWDYKNGVELATFNISNVLANCTANESNATTIYGTDVVTLNFVADSNAKLPTNISVVGATFEWNSSTGTLTLSKPTRNVVITITAEVIDPIEVTGIEVSPTSTSISVGKTTTLKATVLPSDATNQNVIWNSDSADIATIDKNGVVKAVKEGNTTITATTVDGGFIATCTIEVTPAQTVMNEVLTSIDKEGNLYNGLGYKLGYRLNSSGTETENSSSIVSGYMPYSGQNIEIIGTNDMTSTHQHDIVFYANDFNTAVYVNQLHPLIDAGIAEWSTQEDSKIHILIDIDKLDEYTSKNIIQDSAYVRVNLIGCNENDFAVVFNSNSNEEQQGYTDIINIADEDYFQGYRVSTSSGGLTEHTADPNYVATRIIDISAYEKPVVIRTSGLNCDANERGYNAYVTFDIDGNKLYGGYLKDGETLSSGMSIAVDENNNATLTITSGNPDDINFDYKGEIQAIRLTGYGNGADWIVTINEEIT